MPRDYYEILGLQRNASPEDIKKAFRREAGKLHPDVNKAPDANERFQELNEAYQVLNDPNKRSTYDRFGHAGLNMNGGGAGFTDFTDLEDIFEEFMGAFTGRRGNTRSSRRRARQGRDLRYDLRLTFEEAVRGVEREIEVSRLEHCETCSGSGAEPGTNPVTCATCNGSGQVRQARQTFLGSMVTVADCPTCNGTGQTIATPCNVCEGRGKKRQQRTLTVNIPAGVDDGTQIRLSGEGESGDFNGPSGNLYVVLSVEPHEFFRRDGHDILLEININVAQAVLGETIIIPTVDGDETVRIEAGTQSGDLMRLKNKGFPKLRPDGRTQGRGDQICIINVVIPTKLSPEQRELFERIGKTLPTQVITGSNDSDNRGSIFNRIFGGGD